MAVRQHEHGRAELHPLGDAGDHGERRQGLEEGRVRRQRELPRVAVGIARADRVRNDNVVARPQALVAQPLHIPGESEQARARRGAAEDGQVAAEFHALAPAAARRVDEALAELVARDHLGEPGALDLAARRLGDGARPDEQHARRPVAARLVACVFSAPSRTSATT